VANYKVGKNGSSLLIYSINYFNWLFLPLRHCLVPRGSFWLQLRDYFRVANLVYLQFNLLIQLVDSAHFHRLRVHSLRNVGVNNFGDLRIRLDLVFIFLVKFLAKQRNEAFFGYTRVVAGPIHIFED
jgi:hypothetical protein